jgi:UDP-N-acetylmuramate dehydrogenase
LDIRAGIVEELERIAPGRVRTGEPMARHTSFGLGGPADLFVAPASPGAFKDAAAFLADERVPVRFLGRGTNLLVRGGGIEGCVLAASKAFTRLERRGCEVVAGSGVALARLLAFCAEEGLGGLDGLAGIPGTVGGAVVTNAGSFGVSMGDRLAEIVVFQPGRDSKRMAARELDVRYRRIAVPAGSVVEEAVVALAPCDPETVAARQREALESKWRTQPVGMRSAGCVFRNPEGAAAGRLIDAAGLKGTRVGGAVVSDVHADYIVNDRGATPDDVETLIAIVREKVLKHAGVELELEIEIAGRRDV